MKRERAQVFARMGKDAEQRIADQGISFAEVYPPAWVSGFLPIRDEINPALLLLKLFYKGYGLCLPVMEAKNKPLLFRAWKPGDPLQEVMWGIKEPLANAPYVEPDIVLGPLLAFDRVGHRLGYGGGYYDRTLKRLRAIKP
ncbi:MAG: 5-formyltetrahydrofolate cyclo-ligase, partial [Hyphomicrobium sp.]